MAAGVVILLEIVDVQHQEPDGLLRFPGSLPPPGEKLFQIASILQLGQLVQPGQSMVDIVDGSELWVVANYRETQLPGIKVGSKVKVVADAVPGTEFEGTVERISDATGSAFSMVPQDNATGNFVKVEQRIPVRISLGNDRKRLAQLRAGMNVECTVVK